MRLALLFSLLTASTVLAGEHFLMAAYNQKVCFHVHTPTTLVLNVTSYKASDEFDEFKERFDKQETVHIVAYRKNKVDFSHRFHGQHSELRHCVPEAVDLGFCSTEQLGQFLYKAKEGTDYTPPINGVYKPFNASYPEESVATTELEEQGYYCVQTSSRWAKSYTVDVTLEDGYNMKKDTRNTLNVISFDLAVDFALFAFLVVSWLGHQIPFVVQWQMFLRASALAYMTWDLCEVWMYDLASMGSSEGPSNSFIYTFVHDSVVLWVHTFMYYQYAGEFTYNRITEFEHVKLFIIIQLVLVYDLLLKALKFQTGMELSEVLTPVVATTLSTLLGFTSIGIKAYIYFRMFMRYRQSVKLFTDFNKGNHPTLKQFRALFWLEWSGTFFAPVLYGFVWLMVGQVLPQLSDYYSDNFTIDGKAHSEHLMSAFFVVLVGGVLNGYVNWAYWTPKYFKKVEEFKEREE